LNRLVSSLLLMATICLIGYVAAHPPSKMELSYDHEAGDLVVEYSHLVSNVDHYLNYTEIWKNGELYRTEIYDSQPTQDSFAYRYEVDAEEGDVFSVYVDCSFGGSMERELVVGSDGSEGEVELWIWHAVVMGLAFALLAVSTVALYMKGHRWWFKVHKYLGYVGSVAAIAGLVIGVYMVSRWGGGHIRVAHSYIGLAAMVVALLNVVLGIVFTKVRAFKRKVRTFHRIIGWIALGLMALAILWGLSQSGLI